MLRTLHALATEDRPASAAEQAVLARWSGWGAVPKVFGPEATEFAAERGELAALLSESEYAAARRSTLNAHYTDAAYVQPVWEALQRLGLRSGQVLEPGCGSGNFLGFAPAQVAMTGVELDPTTAEIARAIYPHSTVLTGSFAEVHGGDEAFDAAVGNVPFSRVRLHDPGYNDAHHPMHTHFVLKSLRMTRPGGLVGVWVSRWLLDGRDETARAEMAELADLISAVRAPAGAHAEAAGTDVVTDFVLLRRREPDAEPDTATGWRQVQTLVLDAAEETTSTTQEALEDSQVGINEYFLQNPDHVLGSLQTRQGRFGPELTVTAHPGVSVADGLRRVLDGDVDRALARGLGLSTPAVPSPAPDLQLGRDMQGRFEGTLTALDDGTFSRWQAGQWVPHEPPKKQAPELRALLELRDGLQALLDAENATSDDTSEIAELRAELNRNYDAYVARYGVLNRFSWRAQSKPGWSAFGAWCVERGYTKLPATGDVVLEYLDWLEQSGCDRALLQRHWEAIHQRHTTKNVPFDEAVQAQAEERIAACREHPAETLDLEALGLSTYTRVSPPQGGFRTDPFSSLVRALEVFDPVSQRAEKADVFSQRVVAPYTPPSRADSPADAISMSLTTYAELRLDYVAELLEWDSAEQARERLTSGDRPLAFTEPDSGRTVVRNEYLSGDVRTKLAAAEQAALTEPRFEVNVAALRPVIPADLGPDEIEVQLGAWIEASYIQQFLRELLDDDTQVDHLGRFWSVQGGNRHSTAARDTWGTEQRSAQELVEAVLTGRTIRVTYTDADGATHTDAEATEAAKAQARALGERFQEWVWEATDRAEELVATYNARFNAHIPRSYDDIELTTPGLATHVQGKPLTLRPHQQAAIAAMIFQPSFGLWHEVGAGKTLEMIVGSMERKRLGLVSKQVVNVPNHMLAQFEREWLQAYPQAKLLVASSEELSGTRRRDFVARAMTGNYDAVILTEGAFKALPVSPEAEERFIAAEADDIEAALAAARTNGAHERTIKELEERKSTAEEAAKGKLAKLARDTGISWEDLGFDSVIVDESQRFKNSRRFSGLPDMGHPGSDRATDLDMKLGLLVEEFGEARYTTATATPFTNSLAEIYTELRRLGAQVDDLDTWARTWGELMATQEMTPGGGFKEMTRLRKLVNVPELAMWMRLHADIRTAEHLQLPVPEVAGGGPQAVAVPASDELIDFNAELAQRYAQLKPRPEKGDDNHLSLIGAGTAAALDVRLVGRATSEPQKVDQLADRIAQRYFDTKDTVYLAADGSQHPTPGGLQLVFCSTSTPDPSRWNFYDELRSTLVARGVPEHLVRFVHEAASDQKRAELFAAARSGEVAVLVGSSEKMGTGTNVQTRALGIYQVSPPWRADTVHQEAGRVVRQGNQNAVVFVERWTTERSLEAKKWQVVMQKWESFRPLMTGELDRRVIEMPDEDTDHYAELMAVASGDDRVRRKASLEADVNRLTRLHKAWARQQTSYRVTASRADERIPGLREQISQLEAGLQARVDTSGEQFAMLLEGTRHTERSPAATHLAELIRRQVPAAPEDATIEVPLGALGGLDLRVQIRRWHYRHTLALRFDGVPGEVTLHHRDVPTSHHGLITRLENWLSGLETQRDKLTDTITTLRGEADRVQPLIGQPFSQQQELDNATLRLDHLVKDLAGESDVEASVREITTSLTTLGNDQNPALDTATHRALHEHALELLARDDLAEQARTATAEDLQSALAEALGETAPSDDTPLGRMLASSEFRTRLAALLATHAPGYRAALDEAAHVQALQEGTATSAASRTPSTGQDTASSPSSAAAAEVTTTEAEIETLGEPEQIVESKERDAASAAPALEATGEPAAARSAQQETTAPAGESIGVHIGAEGAPPQLDVPAGLATAIATESASAAENVSTASAGPDQQETAASMPEAGSAAPSTVKTRVQAQELADEELDLTDLALEDNEVGLLRQAAWWLLTNTELTRLAHAPETTEQEFADELEQHTRTILSEILTYRGPRQLQQLLYQDETFRSAVLQRLTAFAASHLQARPTAATEQPAPAAGTEVASTAPPDTVTDAAATASADSLGELGARLEPAVRQLLARREVTAEEAELAALLAALEQLGREPEMQQAAQVNALDNYLLWVPKRVTDLLVEAVSDPIPEGIAQTFAEKFFHRDQETLLSELATLFGHHSYALVHDQPVAPVLLPELAAPQEIVAAVGAVCTRAGIDDQELHARLVGVLREAAENRPFRDGFTYAQTRTSSQLTRALIAQNSLSHEQAQRLTHQLLELLPRSEEPLLAFAEHEPEAPRLDADSVAATGIEDAGAASIQDTDRGEGSSSTAESPSSESEPGERAAGKQDAGASGGAWPESPEAPASTTGTEETAPQRADALRLQEVGPLESSEQAVPNPSESSVSAPEPVQVDQTESGAEASGKAPVEQDAREDTPLPVGTALGSADELPEELRALFDEHLEAVVAEEAVTASAEADGDREFWLEVECAVQRSLSAAAQQAVVAGTSDEVGYRLLRGDEEQQRQFADAVHAGVAARLRAHGQHVTQRGVLVDQLQQAERAPAAVLELLAPSTLARASASVAELHREEALARLGEGLIAPSPSAEEVPARQVLVRLLEAGRHSFGARNIAQQRLEAEFLRPVEQADPALRQGVVEQVGRYAEALRARQHGGDQLAAVLRNVEIGEIAEELDTVATLAAERFELTAPPAARPRRQQPAELAEDVHTLHAPRFNQPIPEDSLLYAPLQAPSLAEARRAYARISQTRALPVGTAVVLATMWQLQHGQLSLEQARELFVRGDQAELWPRAGHVVTDPASGAQITLSRAQPDTAGQVVLHGTDVHTMRKARLSMSPQAQLTADEAVWRLDDPHAPTVSVSQQPEPSTTPLEQAAAQAEPVAAADHAPASARQEGPVEPVEQQDSSNEVDVAEPPEAPSTVPAASTPSGPVQEDLFSLAPGPVSSTDEPVSQDRDVDEQSSEQAAGPGAEQATTSRAEAAADQELATQEAPVGSEQASQPPSAPTEETGLDPAVETVTSAVAVGGQQQASLPWWQELATEHDLQVQDEVSSSAGTGWMLVENGFPQLPVAATDGAGREWTCGASVVPAAELGDYLARYRQLVPIGALAGFATLEADLPERVVAVAHAALQPGQPAEVGTDLGLARDLLASGRPLSVIQRWVHSAEQTVVADPAPQPSAPAPVEDQTVAAKQDTAPTEAVSAPPEKAPAARVVWPGPDTGQATLDHLAHINAAAAEYFATELDRSPTAQEYLAERLGTPQAAERLRERVVVGYAPRHWTGLVEHLRTLGYADEELLAAGVASRSRRSEELITAFYDRLIFGLRDAQGRLAGFTGRDLSGQAQAKYRNTATTELFAKQQVLFGAYEQREQTATAEQVVLAEGPFDAAALIAHDVVAVAACGTAVTDTHLQQIDALMSPEHTLVYASDGDRAGHRAGLATVEQALQTTSRPVTVVSPPDGHDPASWVREHGPEAVAAYREGTPGLQALAAECLRGRDLQEVEQNVDAGRAIARLLARFDPYGPRRQEVVTTAVWATLPQQQLLLDSAQMPELIAEYRTTSTPTSPAAVAAPPRTDQAEQPLPADGEADSTGQIVPEDIHPDPAAPLAPSPATEDESAATEETPPALSPQPAIEDEPAQDPPARPELVVQHSRQFGTLLLGTRGDEAISSTFRAARQTGLQVGAWRWDPQVPTPDGGQGAWAIPGTAGYLATPRAVALLSEATRVLTDSGLPARLQLPETDTHPAAGPSAATEASRASATSGPDVRPPKRAEQAIWWHSTDDSPVQLAESNGRWCLRAVGTHDGHELELQMSFREHERAVDSLQRLHSHPQQLPDLARRAVTTGQGVAWCDDEPLVPSLTEGQLAALLATPVAPPAAPVAGARSSPQKQAYTQVATGLTAPTGSRPAPTSTDGPPVRPAATSPASQSRPAAQNRTR